jgi:protein TonB
MPELAEHALATIHGKVIVNVRVDVDASGAVTDAKLEYTGSSKYLAASALQAARRWRFKPETIDGQAAPQQWRVQFEFRSSGIKAQPRRLSP